MGRGICSDMVLTGQCHRTHVTCSFNHDLALFCRLCSSSFSSQQYRNKHDHSAQHKHRDRICVPYCPVCRTDVGGRVSWEDHRDTPAHQSALERLGFTFQSPFPSYRDTTVVEDGFQRCEICHLDVPIERWEHHVAMGAHRIKRTLTYLPPRLKRSLIVGVNGGGGDGGRRPGGGGRRSKLTPSVTLSHWSSGVDFGVIESAARGAAIYTRSLNLNVKTDDIRFVGVELTSSIENRPAAGFASPRAPTGILKRGSNPTVQLTFTATDQTGVFTDTVELKFLDTSKGHQFVIYRSLRCEVVPAALKADFEFLQPKSEYKPPPPQQQQAMFAKAHAPPSTLKTMGRMPEEPYRVDFVTRLPFFDVPRELRQVLTTHAPKGLIGAVKNGFMPKGKDVTWENFVPYWQNLLWVEEEQQRIDLLKYSLEEVDLIEQGNLYYIPVDGLIEKRPSVVVGDLLKINLTREPNVKHGGYVHKVQDKGVLVHLDRNFPYMRRAEYDVEFTLNRLPLRRQHQAVTQALANELGPLAKRIVFPEVADLKTRRRSRVASFTPLNRQMVDNGPQKEAVLRVLDLPPGSPPFIVFGPFGTGKTTTLVESLEQLIIQHENRQRYGSLARTSTSITPLRILACAPSNAAADAIAMKLEHLGKSRLLRLNAPTREWLNLTPDQQAFHKEFAFWVEGSEGKRFRLPERYELDKFEVVVSTCVSGGLPSAIGTRRGHFDWIFVDEAGQASEPEVLIPLLTNMDAKTNVVLCGDPKQLGPIIHSPVARALGHGRSFLDRLMALEMYDEKQNSGITVVKLLNNFRNHERILKFPNDQFYDKELRHNADPFLTRRLEDWSMLPTKGFPIIFHGIVGQDKREGTSPSYFNPNEVLEVRNYVEDLTKSTKLGIRASDIGVIAPYAAQCTKIRNLLRGDRYKDVKVGSVEEFQGQERAVIIMSTTRSSANNVAYDIRHSLGFLASPRRLNVAITRAKACLIFVGNPLVLGLDPLWRSLINYIHVNGGYHRRSVKLDWNPRAEVNFDDPNFYARARADALISRMDALERRLRGTVMASQTERDGLGGGELDLEERYEDEEDQVLYVAAGERIGWRDDT